jgi:hypothetical protein
MEPEVKIYPTKQLALDSAFDWLFANDLNDVVSPNRLVQTLIPNTIHEEDLGTKSYMVITLGEASVFSLLGLQKVRRELIQQQMDILDAKKTKLIGDNAWLKGGV